MTQPNVDELRRDAENYLARALGPRAPRDLHLAATFAESPLESEGRVALFTFDLPHLAGELEVGTNRGHFVVVGETEPNYYPCYALEADAAYSLHIGTRVMVATGTRVADCEQEPEGARQRMRDFVSACNPDVAVEEERLAGLYRCGEHFLAVYRVRLLGQDVYCMGGDCPPGFYQMTRHPPQVALRLHLGQLLRAEARTEAGLQPARGLPPRARSE
jgi:hypothetical protein